MDNLKFLSIKRRKDLEQAANDGYVKRRADEEPPHRHALGASDIGKDCGRALWYTFRHVKADNFTGKGELLRLFGVGHAQEPIFARDLAAAGVTLSTHRADGAQHRYAIFGGHFAVNLDGLALVPDADPAKPPKKMIVEMKTMNASNFERLEKVGVKESHPGYYKQMQAQGMTFKVSTFKAFDGFLFVAVNKNTSKYRIEEVDEDLECQRELWRLLMAVIQKDAPPPPLQVSASSAPCRWCKYRKLCRDGLESEVERSCRSCAYAEPDGGRQTPMHDGPADWTCTQEGQTFGTLCDRWIFDSSY